MSFREDNIKDMLDNGKVVSFRGTWLIRSKSSYLLRDYSMVAVLVLTEPDEYTWDSMKSARTFYNFWRTSNGGDAIIYEDSVGKVKPFHEPTDEPLGELSGTW
jgi:hypothetical protein